MKFLDSLINRIATMKTTKAPTKEALPMFPRSSSHLNPNTRTGIVKWFDKSKGFGFILQEYGKDIFVHYSDIISNGGRTLEEGATVSFVLVQTPKGPQAQRVVVQNQPVAIAA